MKVTGNLLRRIEPMLRKWGVDIIILDSAQGRLSLEGNVLIKGEAYKETNPTVTRSIHPLGRPTFIERQLCAQYFRYLLHSTCPNVIHRLPHRTYYICRVSGTNVFLSPHVSN